MEFAFYFFVSLACSISLSLLPWREFCSLEQWALQPHRDQCHSQTVTHIYTVPHTHTRTRNSLMRQVPTHIHTLIIWHTPHTLKHWHTLFHLAAILTSCPWRGSGLKIQLSLSPLLNPLQLPVSPLPEVASPSHPVCHCSVKLTGDMMIEMPQTWGRMVLVKWNALSNLGGILSRSWGFSTGNFWNSLNSDCVSSVM